MIYRRQALGAGRLPDGRYEQELHQNGLDPLVVSEIVRLRAARCKRSKHHDQCTFVLAAMTELVRFVQQVSQMCPGKAYFTSPDRLGEYLLMDFMSRKSKTIH